MRGCWSSLSRIGVREMLSYQSLMRVGAGTPRYEKARVVVCYGELARRILPRPTPTPAGDKPLALHFLILPSAIGLQFERFRPWRAGIEVYWRAHFRTNDEAGDFGVRRE